MKRVAEALGISRPYLSANREIREVKRAPYKNEDTALLKQIDKLVEQRPNYGYRRMTALLSRQPKEAPVSHKRVYRVKYGTRPKRAYEGKVTTLKNNLRWCGDDFEIRCSNDDKVYVAFSLDCCDREAIGSVAATPHLKAGDLWDRTTVSVEARFGGTRALAPTDSLAGPTPTEKGIRFDGGNFSTLDPTGFICRKEDQPDGSCEDYEVRYHCP